MIVDVETGRILRAMMVATGILEAVYKTDNFGLSNASVGQRRFEVWRITATL